MRREYKTLPYPEKRGKVWRAVYRDALGRRKYQSLKETNENRAWAKFNELMRSVDTGVLGWSPRPRIFPFPEIADRFLAEGINDISPWTARRYRQCIENQLKPYFKKDSIKAIKSPQVINYARARQNQKAAPNTIRNEIASLSAIFNFCVAQGIIDFNPAKGIKRPAPEIIRPNYCPKEYEVFLILDKLHETAKPFFLTLINTGLRLGGIQKLNVGDVDFDERVMRVVLKGGKKDIVPITDVLEVILKTAIKGREDKSDAPLFLNEHGKRYLRITRSLRTACEKAKVPHCTHHSLRHAYATMLLKTGIVPIEDISKLLHHSSIEITRKVYLHWMTDRLRQAASKVQIATKLQQSPKIADFEKKRKAVSDRKERVPGDRIELPTRGFSEDE